MARCAPVFIGGAGRSGTTLAVDMIGLHPKISPVYETDFVNSILTTLFGSQGPLNTDKIASFANMRDIWSKELKPIVKEVPPFSEVLGEIKMRFDDVYGRTINKIR